MNDAQIALAVVIRFQICIFDILNTVIGAQYNKYALL